MFTYIKWKTFGGPAIRAVIPATGAVVAGLLFAAPAGAAVIDLTLVDLGRISTEALSISARAVPASRGECFHVVGVDKPVEPLAGDRGPMRNGDAMVQAGSQAASKAMRLKGAPISHRYDIGESKQADGWAAYVMLGLGRVDAIDVGLGVYGSFRIQGDGSRTVTYIPDRRWY